MTHEEQNERWAQLSESQRKERQNAYKELKANGSTENELTKYHLTHIELESLYGSHNLQPKLIYEDVVRELFKEGSYQFADYGGESNTTYNKAGNELYFLNFTSPKQAEKLIAIHKLLNVAKYINKKEDGTDWVANFPDGMWTIGVDRYGGTVNPVTTSMYDYGTEIVYFRSKGIAQQAIEILGEDTIRTALSTDY